MIAWSAGNHAQGVACHAARLGIPSVIVMPFHTPFVKVEHTRNHGAEVILDGDGFEEAKQVALRLAETRGLVVVHPYDDEKIIAGQGTIGLEMLETYPELDTLVIAIGGGGLLSGISVRPSRSSRPSRWLASRQGVSRGCTARCGERNRNSALPRSPTESR